MRGIEGTVSVNSSDYKGVVMPGNISLVVDLKYSASHIFELKNFDKAPIEFALSRTELKMEGTITPVLPDGTVAVRTDKLNTGFYVKNLGTEPAEFKVWIIE